jgi:phage gp16-like protein
MRTRPDLRAKEITLIHIAKAHLGLDEATYRAQIGRISQGRTTSSAALTAMERDSLLAEYRLAGWVPTTIAKRAGRGPTAAAMDRRAMLTKVNALLADQRLPWAYAEAILRRQRGITDATVACPLAQTTDVELRGVIAALHRRGKRPPTPPAAA